VYGVVSQSKKQRRRDRVEAAVKTSKRKKKASSHCNWDPWEEYLRWNRSQTTGLSRADLSPVVEIADDSHFVMQVTDLAVDEVKIVETKTKKHRKSLASGLEKLK